MSNTRPRFARYSRWGLLRALVSGWNRRLEVSLNISRQADVVRVPVPGRPMYLVTHPDDIRHILVTRRERFPKSYDYDVLREYMGDGLVTSDGKRWQADRKLLGPSFSRAETEPCLPMMQQEVDRLIERWKTTDQPIEPFAEMMALTITVMGRRLLGCDLSHKAGRIRRAIDHCAKHAVKRSQSPIDWVRWMRTPGERRAQRCKTELRGILDEARRQSDDRNCVAALLERHRPDEILDHLVTLFAAGYDTTGNALAWCLYQLAREPELQQRVRLGLADSETGQSYLQALVRETLRFYPTVPGVGRACPEGDDWNDIELPAGSTLFLFFYGLHHREDLWPDPERFWPERFLPDNKELLPRKAYFPFGAGPRVCIGSHFASQELQVALSMLLPAFRFELVGTPSLRPVPGISLTPSGPLQLKLYRQDKR